MILFIILWLLLYSLILILSDEQIKEITRDCITVLAPFCEIMLKEMIIDKKSADEADEAYRILEEQMIETLNSELFKKWSSVLPDAWESGNWVDVFSESFSSYLSAISSIGVQNGYCTRWWLRQGVVDEYGCCTDTNSYDVNGVRPAMWIEL